MESFDKIWPISDCPSEFISIYDGPEVFLSEFSKVSPAHQVVFAARWLQAEVFNGGLRQFFSNDTGVLAPEAVLAFRALGLPELARKCEEAIAWFGEPYPRERKIRQAALDAHREANTDTYSPFDALEELVVALIYQESGGLDQAALEFVKVHGDKQTNAGG